MNIEDALLDLTADLVEFEEKSLFLERLFSNLKSVYGKGYCVTTFFLEELHWSNVALYNKQKVSRWFSY